MIKLSDKIKLFILSIFLIMGGIVLSNGIYWNSLGVAKINDFLGFSDYYSPYSVMKFIVACTLIIFMLFVIVYTNSELSYTKKKLWLLGISIPYFIIASFLGYSRMEDLLRGKNVTYIGDTAITKEGKEERIKSIQSPASTNPLNLYFTEDNKTLIVSPTSAPDNIFMLGNSNIVTIHKFKESEPFGSHRYIPLE